MTTEPTIHVAILAYSEGGIARAFRADTAEAAVARATAALLEETSYYRDHEDYETDDAWLEACWEDGWEITLAILE